MNPHYQAIEHNWRILIESFGAARAATKAEATCTPETRYELLTRLDALETTLRSLESCWKPIREKLPAPQKQGNEDLAEEEPIPDTTPQKAYLLPLVQVLQQLGGRALVKDAIKATLERMRPVLLKGDFEPTESGSIRYDHNIRFTREKLKLLGLIKPTNHDSIWELTEAGQRAAGAGIIPRVPVPESDPSQMSLFG